MPRFFERNPLPTLVLYGPEDHVIWKDFPERAEVVFPNRIGPLIVPRAGHFLQWERADVLNQCLIYFFARPAELGEMPTSIRDSKILVTGATGGIGHAIARTLHAARRAVDAHRPPARAARSAPGGAGRRRHGRRGGPRRPRRACRAGGARVVRRAGCERRPAGQRSLGRLQRRADRRRDRRQPARADAARARAGAGDGRAGQRARSCWCRRWRGKVASPQERDLQRDQVRAARLRLLDERGSARYRRRRVDDLSRASSATRACSTTAASSCRRASARALPSRSPRRSRPRSRRGRPRSTSRRCRCAAAAGLSERAPSLLASLQRKLGGDRVGDQIVEQSAQQALIAPGRGRLQRELPDHRRELLRLILGAEGARVLQLLQL